MSSSDESNDMPKPVDAKNKKIIKNVKYKKMKSGNKLINIPK